ncbi:hypothetical protein QTP88_022308 [Uroleucon formosanum]
MFQNIIIYGGHSVICKNKLKNIKYLFLLFLCDKQNSSTVQVPTYYHGKFRCNKQYNLILNCNFYTPVRVQYKYTKPTVINEQHYQLSIITLQTSFDFHRINMGIFEMNHII